MPPILWLLFCFGDKSLTILAETDLELMILPPLPPKLLRLQLCTTMPELRVLFFLTFNMGNFQVNNLVT